MESAIREGNLERIKKLVENGENFNLKNERGLAPLHIAATLGKINIIEYLFKIGANIDIRDLYEQTPLHKAASNRDNMAVIKYLVMAGACVNAVDVDGKTPLHITSIYDQLEASRYLINHGADIHAKDHKGISILMDAICFSENPDIIKELLEAGVDVNAQDVNGNSAPFYMSRNNIASQISYNPSHESTTHRIYELLFEYGANVNLQNENGETPLMHAVINDKIYYANVLIKSGANIHAKDYKGWSSLMFAIYLDNLKFAKFLIFSGANVHEQDCFGRNILHVTAEKLEFDMFEFFLEAKVDVNLKDVFGLTPLFCVALNERDIFHSPCYILRYLRKYMTITQNIGLRDFLELYFVQRQEEIFINSIKMMIQYEVLYNPRATKPGYINSDNSLSLWWDKCLKQRSEMPPKKRKPIGKVLPKVSKKRNVRSAETAVQREHRLRINRERASTSRAAESVGQRENRLQQERDRACTSRAAESLEQRENRLQQERDRASTSRAAESVGQRENRLQQDRDRASTSRAAESLEQRENRLQQEKDRASTSRAAESLEQRENRLQHERDRASTSRAAESVGQRENRLRQNRNRVSTSRAAETPQEHTARILNVRERTLASRNSRDRLSNLLLEGFNYDSCKNYEQHPSITIGQMSIVCNYCKAKKFKDEPPGFCCKNGKVYLSPPQLPPDELFSLMVRGQVYHRAGSLLPSLDQPPQFLQIFFVEDVQLEVNQRCHFSSALRHGTVLCLQRMFHRCNQLIKIFKGALENMPLDEYKLVIRADKTPSGEHERRFNAPQSNDVAVVLSADEFNQRDIIIQRRSNALKRISETHRSYDPLQYPIIFWDGEDGYHFNYRQIDQNTGVPTNRKVSAMSFYSYRIMARDNVYNLILNCRQLFSQYIVDMYAKIESERLLYIRLNQKELRVEEYIHLRDAVANDGMVANFGKLVILPATFTGSPRHMHEYTQDAMVFVRTYGRPDLFIIFTCNPSWPEINAELFNGQKPMDRHDLTARVFKLKLNKLIALITKKCIFGETRCWMFTIEWQKRGLPHSHILIWLKDKIHPIQIDNVISAEIPNPEEDPNLYEVVIKNMIHGPCGTFNINAPCMKNGKCSKNYPRDLISDTQTGFDGYPRYRRRAPENGGFKGKLKGRGNTEIEVDNKWVVPYSPLRSRMFKAHINVEYCHSVKSIKVMQYNDNLRNLVANINKVFCTAISSKIDDLNQPTTSKIELPKFNLPSFSSDVNEWLSFKQLFSLSIDSNTALTDSQKLQYLQSAVTGDAERLIRGFPIIDENYAHAWATLVSRYDNKKELALSQCTKLFTLKPLKLINSKAIFGLLDMCNEAIRNLKSLGLERNTLVDIFLIHFLQRKIGDDLKRQWELTLIDDGFPSYKNFIMFLEKQAKSLQSIKGYAKEDKSVVKQTHVYNSISKGDEKCLLCKNSHPIFKCDKFHKSSLLERWNIIKTNNLCFNCLRSNHRVTSCKFTMHCKSCNKKHHTLLHSFQPESLNTTSIKAPIAQSSISCFLSDTTRPNETILLSTAIVRVRAENGSFHPCRALIDTGSQRSLITENCREKFNLPVKKSQLTVFGIGNQPIQQSASETFLQFKPHISDRIFKISSIILDQITDLDWDDPLSESLCSHWRRVKMDLAMLNHIKIPRYISCKGLIHSLELHGFCDASESAYSSVVYMKSRFKSGHVQVTLIAAKTKVAPLKATSIPRLELCAALLLSNLYDSICSPLLLQIDRVILWTDSQIVLCWIKSESKHWKPFVGNRIAEIQRLTLQSSWYYVSTKDNPADCASRGITSSEQVNHSLWWNGPDWLSNSSLQDPLPITYELPKEVCHEKRKTVPIVHFTTCLILNFIFKFSTFRKLSRVTAWLLRFIHNARHSSDKIKHKELSSNELDNSIRTLIQIIQSSEFKTEIQCCNQSKVLPSNSKPLSLNPFIDSSGILRVGGRLRKSNLQFNEKHPIILPHNHFVTELIVQQFHVEHLHSGLQLTLCAIRQKYWIPYGRILVKKLINRCMTCFKTKRQVSKQIMGDLPIHRIIPSSRFSKTGIDFAGPFITKPNVIRTKVTLKSYIALFICFSTKAIHLEIVSDLSTPAFLAAFRRFISRRGKPSDIFTDNATNFKGAKNILNNIHQLVKDSSIQNYVTNEHITRHFIPPSAPNFGGIWEAGIKSLKYHLLRLFNVEKMLSSELVLTIAKMSSIYLCHDKISMWYCSTICLSIWRMTISDSGEDSGLPIGVPFVWLKTDDCWMWLKKSGVEDMDAVASPSLSIGESNLARKEDKGAAGDKCGKQNKGNDMAIFGLSKENTNDEISQYLLGRYISSNEAVWRILSFPIHERHPNVVHLSVHLENGQRVYFTNANARTVAAAPPNTTLTAFFQLCQQDPFAKNLLYPEVPRYYTWNASRKSFSRKKQGTSVPEHEDIFASEALGRVYTVHPNNAECFFLRMLLHTVRGPISFSSLKCFNGEECRTFREACQNLGLLEDDQHWDNVLSEAASQSFPEQIRELFAILLTTCNPSNSQNLWEKYRESMSEDVLIKARRANPTLDINFSSDIFNEALLLLQNKCLAINDKTLYILRMILFFTAQYNNVGNNTNKHYAKPYLHISTIYLNITIVMQNTTIANEQYPTCNISSTSGQAQVLKSCRIIVWDECTMAHKHSLEALDRTLRDLKGNNKLMGGILLLLAGDFRQTLPVIPRSTPADEINACLKASVLWKHIKKITLRTNLRVQVLGDHSAQNFARKLLQIGEGTFPNGSPMCDVSFPLDFGNIVSSVGELIDKVFPNIAENFKNHRWLCERTILAPRNDAVDEINNCIQDMLPGSVTEYNSINTMVDVDDTVNYPSEFLNSLNPSGLPPHHLRLKIGSPIMLLRNLDPHKLCNGTRLCVKRLLPNVIEATILTGKENGKDVLIPRIPLIPNDFPFLFKRLQFPVRLAFAITINKAQGQSLKCCGVNLESPCTLPESGLPQERKTWLSPPTSGTWLPPRRRRLLRLWEAVSETLELNHRVLPPHQLQELHVIEDCRFLRPPDLLVASRWAGLRVGDITSSSSLPLRTTRATLADVAALTTFCSLLVEQNRNHIHRVDNIENAIVLRGTATPLQRLTTRTARRMLERPRLAALPITQLLGRWLPHISISISWSSLRRGAYSGHNADVTVRLALHALPHPAHPASARESCIACGSGD
ncbi:hypothetical protein LAZ67_19001416, partial [Cordylochernes scorpioides]